MIPDLPSDDPSLTLITPDLTSPNPSSGGRARRQLLARGWRVQEADEDHHLLSGGVCLAAARPG